jgi:nitroreductase
VPKLISDIDLVLTTTRAVRRRLDLDRPVEREVIEECLRLAQQATMGSNVEDWRFVAVTEASRKEQIAELYRDVWLKTVEIPLRERRPATVARLDPGVRGDPEAAARQERVLASVKYLVDRLERVPVLVFACSAKPVPDRALGDRASGYYGSIVPVTWSFQLVLRSRGLGSVFASAIVFHADRLSRILELPEGTHPITMIPVAYTDTLDFKPAPRKPVHEILRWERWGEDN